MLEICVDSLASARAAIASGADRLELCAALAVGGLTPYTALLRQIRAESDIPIRCLMRHRAGDFLYSPDEVELLRLQIMELKAAGADGFVIGCLTPDGYLDKDAMCPLIEAAGDSGLAPLGILIIHIGRVGKIVVQLLIGQLSRAVLDRKAAALVKSEVQNQVLLVAVPTASGEDYRHQ